MRKFFVVLCALLTACVMFGCENATEVEASYISAISSPSSDTQAVKVTFAKDSRLKDKVVDCQIRFDKVGTVFVWLDGQEKVEYVIEKYDYWYSLTEILSKANEEKIKFENFDETLSKTILFQAEQEQEVSIRVVVGQREWDFENEGEILVGSEPISKQFRLKIGKK